MSNVTNLGKFRKKKERENKKAKAEENRIRFGLKKEQRDARTQEEDRSQRQFDGHRLNKEDDPDP